MNATLEILLNRKSVRSYEKRPIPEEVKNEILRAAMRAPTAGNMMLYSIIHVRDPIARQTLARTCDNQPFIAEAPLVLLFLADYQKWFDYFQLSRTRGEAILPPEEADLFLACCDTLIAAQTAVIAAESLGIGSCYIGDIMENYEVHRDLFLLPKYVFPICLLCFGYATKQQLERPLTTRFGGEYVVFEDKYRLLQADDFRKMFEEDKPGGRLGDFGQLMYVRKFSAGFSKEMRRSVGVILERWLAKNVELE
jgi:nitroreductase